MDNTTATRLQLIKTKILDFISRNGPTLPVRLTSIIEKDTMFVGAILSELLSNKQLKITHAKIGGSRLYYRPGQEEKLSILYTHLPMREQEAYNLLKEKRYINNADLEPAIRVAMKNLEDFAVPSQQGDQSIWRWHAAPPQVLPQQPTPQVLQPQQQPAPQQRLMPSITLQQPQQKKKTEDKSSAFLETLTSFMKARSIATLSTETEKKNREYVYTVELPSSIGPLHMLLIAKNKKLLNENDLILAHNLGQSKKLPTLLITPGQLNKKAQLYREKHLRGLLLFHVV